jgi:hypothetical protein
MGALHQSLNTPAGSAQAAFRTLEACAGESSTRWRANSPTRNLNPSYRPTILSMSVASARNSLPNPMDMEEEACNRLRSKVIQIHHPKQIAKEKLVEVFRRRQAANFREFEQSRKYRNALKGILEPTSIKPVPEHQRIFSGLESLEDFGEVSNE